MRFKIGDRTRLDNGKRVIRIWARVSANCMDAIFHTLVFYSFTATNNSEGWTHVMMQFVHRFLYETCVVNTTVSTSDKYGSADIFS